MALFRTSVDLIGRVKRVVRGGCFTGGCTRVLRGLCSSCFDGALQVVMRPYQGPGRLRRGLIAHYNIFSQILHGVVHGTIH